MKKPKASSVIITGQFVLLVACLAYLGWGKYVNWVLKMNGKMIATEVGFERARADYERGRRVIYEMKLFKYGDTGQALLDDMNERTGRSEGPFEVWSLLTTADAPAEFIEIRQALINGYNQHMHQFVEHPEHFDAMGFVIVHHGKSEKPSEKVK